MTSFADLGVVRPLAQALAHSGFSEPFPIQIATLPDAIKGRDVLGRGRTGSGKTLAFSLALLSRLDNRKAKRGKPLALVLSPTRELAMQINEVISPLARKVGLSSVLIAGGMPFGRQLQALDHGVPIVVATPGRLIDLMHRGAVDLSDIEITVLDEADLMSDMGFMPDVKEILSATNQDGQRLLFSATLDKDVDALVKKYLMDPIEHAVESAGIAQGEMDHHVFFVKQEVRDEMLAKIGSRDGRTIFFVRTQRGADRLAEKLQAQGIAAGTLHGGKAQGARTRALDSFRSGKTPVLVATNVAARGIHVDDISLVVHADAPTDPKDYLHRAGRTARAGESGTVVTLARLNQQREMKGLIKRALVDATFTHMDVGNPELIRITGAQDPTGEPWFPVAEHAPKKRRNSRPGGHAGEGGAGAVGRHKPRHKSRSGGPGGSSSDGSRSDRPRSERSKSAGGGGRGRSAGGSGKPGGRPSNKTGGRPSGRPGGKPSSGRPAR
ncbi:MAG: DEAD/DEAH box helicase [Candidatus Nanopelagicales bacterium]|jgi:superfamily II DNA/RNA helicase|nr:DEAD/DEAH box helicase [Actinomycetes bacterium]MCH9841203.1 DEAD/DEAH box helicase [Actinomycetes bacterium]